jgi:DNA-binding NarL/FixJ family response regulator
MSAITRAGLESLVRTAANFTIAESYADVVLAAVPLDELTSGAVIVLIGDAEWSADALRLGVRAVLRPDASAAEILAAIEGAAAGLALIDPVELEALLANAPQPVAESAAPLTGRELEVLRMLADGAANKAIAWKLDISEHTVKSHVAQILGKLQAGTRTEAVTIGIRQGLILL